MRHVLCILLATVTLLGGCVTEGASPDEPAESAASTTVLDGVLMLALPACERMLRCDAARFAEVFDDVDACVDRILEHAPEVYEVDERVAYSDVSACGTWLAEAACTEPSTLCAWSYY